MNRISRLLFAGILAAGVAAFAQGTKQPRYIAYDSVMLSSTAETLTIQQPATNAKQVTFEAGMVYCSVACTVTLAENGTAATATSAIPSPINPNIYAAAAQEYKASNVGGGITLATYAVPAGSTYAIDLSRISMGNTGNGTNLSLAIGSMTGSATISILWSEK